MIEVHQNMINTESASLWPIPGGARALYCIQNMDYVYIIYPPPPPDSRTAPCTPLSRYTEHGVGELRSSFRYAVFMIKSQDSQV